MATEPNWRYDIFLSFAGWDDGQKTFASNLYNALRHKKVRTFLDKGGLKSGDKLSATVLKALEESKISVVILSEEFASSTWCLKELVTIHECKNMKNQLVFPIFYDVDPSDVRDQRGEFGESLKNLERRFNYEEEVEKWRLALLEVVQLEGLCFNTRFDFEYKAIEDVVNRVTDWLPRYDVYLSFCEKDTRYSFTGFLYNALRREGFNVIMKDKGSEKQGQISQSLVTLIENSRLSIIVLSENYAYSSLCLDELVTILNCHERNQLIWPIFYKVDPSDVRHKKNSYAKAMNKHGDKFGKDSKKVQKWRSALFEVANLKGWHLKTSYEYEAIENIVGAAIKFCSSV